MNSLCARYGSVLGVFMLLSIIVLSCINNTKEPSVLLYCAAGMKPVLEEVATQYYNEYGVRVDIQYGGSGTLLSNLRIAKQGDLYLAADKSYLDEAKTYGLIAETQPLAFIKPIIGVAKGNPKNIANLSDLFTGGTKVAIANPDAASIGRLTKEMLVASNLWDSIQNNITVLMPTVSEVANAIKLGSVDAGIIWDAVAKQYNVIEIIEDQYFSTYVKNITIGLLKYSKHPKEALKFLHYLSSKDKVFYELGYQPIDGTNSKLSPY